MTRSLWSLVLVAAMVAGCSKEEPVDETSGELSGTNGSVDGSLSYGDETITFMSGIAFGNSFFHDDRDVILLAAWGDMSCDSTDRFDWETQGEGYQLDIPNDGVSGTEEGLLWDCSVSEEYGAGCGGGDYPMIELTLDTYEPERGGTVKGSITLGSATDDFLSGTIDFELTYCGEG